MNADRRKQIKEQMDKIDSLKEEISSVMEEIDSILSDEEEYRDNGIPENMQNSERYEKAYEACNNLEYAKDQLDTISSGLDDISNYLEEATA